MPSTNQPALTAKPNFGALKQLFVARDEHSAIRVVTLCGVLICAVYAIFGTLLCHGAEHNALITNVMLVCGLTCLLLAYWRGFETAKQYPAVGVKRIALFGIAASVFALCVPDFHSKDLFSYVAPGWQQLHYHLDPYVTTVSETSGYGTDPMLTNYWADNPFPYGFVFAHVTRTICQVGQGNLVLTMQLFKILNWFVYAALGAVVYFGAKRMPVERRDLSLYLYMWSPLLLLQALSNGHNDILMPLLIMLSVACVSDRRFVLAAPLFVAGVLVKYLWLFALPFLLIYVWQRGRVKAVVTACAVGMVALFALSWPYIQDWRTIRWKLMGENLGCLCNSLAAAVHDLGISVNAVMFHNRPPVWFNPGWEAAERVTHLVLIAGFAGFAGWMLFKAVKERQSVTLNAVLQNSLLAMMLWTCLISPKFYPWYLVMFFPAALWLPDRSELRRLVLILTGTQLFAFSFLGQSHIINFVLLSGIPLALAFLRWQKHARMLSSDVVSQRSTANQKNLAGSIR